MQLLTGEINEDTINEVLPGTIFRVVKEVYGRLEATVVLVNGRFKTGLDTDEETLWLEISTMVMGAAYSPTIGQKTLKSTDEFFGHIQHVETEEIIAEFARQAELANVEVNAASNTMLNARLRRSTFAAMQDRLGALL